MSPPSRASVVKTVNSVSSASSEREARAELNPAHVAGGADLSEVGRRVQGRAWVHEIDDVEDVGGLEAELKDGPATERDVAENAEIDVRIARPLDDVPASRAIQPNRGLREGGRIEPLLDQFLARPAAVEFWIADDISTIVREPVEVAVDTRRNRQRLTA